MLVKLYELPKQDLLKNQAAEEIIIRLPMAAEKFMVVNWVEENFGTGWAAEADIAFSNHPCSILIAVHKRKIIGFACYDCTCRNFFGPLGVKENFRGQGTGRALLLITLQKMRDTGYAYAVIGNTDTPAFYEKNAGAVIIEGSTPGIYSETLLVTNHGVSAGTSHPH